jgi:hypothetical protein
MDKVLFSSKSMKWRTSEEIMQDGNDFVMDYLESGIPDELDEYYDYLRERPWEANWDE